MLGAGTAILSSGFKMISFCIGDSFPFSLLTHELRKLLLGAGGAKDGDCCWRFQLSNEKKDIDEVVPHSPNLQVNGQDMLNEESFTFKSDYGKRTTDTEHISFICG